MVWLLLLAVIVLLVFVFVVKQRQAQGQPQTFPYQKQPALFTPAERSFYGVLNQAVGQDFQLFGKVRVADAIAVRSGLTRQARQRAFNPISAKHFDFVLCAPGDLSVLCAIELNDSSHQSQSRQDRDTFLANVCRAAGLPLITFDARRAYSVADVCTRIAEQIAGSPQGTPAAVPTQANGDAAPNSPEPMCPKCSSPMVKRIAKGGQLAGQEFWGCSRFPECRGILSV